MKDSFLSLLAKEVSTQKSKDAFRVIPPHVSIEPKRNAFLAWVYGVGLVEASSYSAHCADKLFFAQLIETHASEAKYFHPKTVGLSWLPKEFDALKEELSTLFPNGFIVKQAGGINSSKRGVYLVEEEFFQDFKNCPKQFLQTEPVKAEASGIISSGEKFIVQEKIFGKMELRLHTLESRVVKGATFTRWNEAWDRDLFERAEESLEKFLQSLPNHLIKAQAWSVDLLKEGNSFRLVEVNTNRGMERQWSGDLVVPETLGAYVRHLEKFYGISFLGESGELFRNNLANREKFLKKVGSQEFETHERLKSSLLEI